MKRLLISVPSKPNGSYAAELSWWLTATQVQSSLLDFGEALAEQSADMADRMRFRQLAERFAVGWGLEQATLQWLDPKKIRDIGKKLIPDGWSVAAAPVYGGPIAANRNEQVRRFLFSFDHAGERLLRTDFDAALFIDDDNVPGRHDLHVLCEDIDRDDVEVVGGVYCMEAPEGPRPLVYTLTEDGEGFNYDSQTIVKPLGLHRLEKGGLPGGCLMVKRGVFEKLWEARRTWFKDRLHDCSFEYHEVADLVARFKEDKAAGFDALVEMANKRGTDWSLPQVGTWHIGEDIWFCKMCHDLDIPIHVDTRVFWKHLKVADNKQTFLRQQRIGRDWFGMGVEHERGTSLSDDEKGEEYTRYARGKVAKKWEPAK